MVEYQFLDSSKEGLRIGKIICLIRSYRKHAKEMGVEPTETPMFFLKPTSAVIFSGDSIITPPQVRSLHHEVEVGVVIGTKGKNILKQDALDHVLGYLIALDITARDIQSEAKKNGWPWGIAKGFDTFAPLSRIILKEHIHSPNDIEFSLSVNGSLRQKGNTKELLWSIESIVSSISEIMTLEPGDLILTGTPEGVGVLKKEDRLFARLADRLTLDLTVK